MMAPEKALIFLLTLLLSDVSFGQELEKLHNEINSTRYDEISPVVSRDGHTLFFTRVGSPDFNRSLVIGGEDVQKADPESYDEYLKEVYHRITGERLNNPAQSDFNQDIWVAESKSDFFDTVMHPPFPLNNALPNSICATTTLPNQFVVINQFPKEGGMKKGFSFIRQREDGSWSPPDPMMIDNFYTKSSGINLCMSSDGEVIVLSLARRDAKGKTDLYLCFRQQDGSWTEPRNLGPLVNSNYREANPFLSEDMRTLFFSSDRPGADGIDIYFSERASSEWTDWSVPRRLSAPVNSPAMDGQPHFNQATGYLYFSSNRDGSSDIFRIRISEPQGQEEVWVKGRIINSETGEPTESRVLTGLTAEADFHKTFYLSSDGRFRLKVPKGQEMQIMPEKVGFIGHPEFVYFDTSTYYFKPIEVDLFLDPISVDAKISLRPIYFEQSKPIILSRSYRELDRLAKIMEDLPEMHIQIEGHTDNVGNRKSLQKLSEERAEAVRDHLLRKGIAAERVQTTGFGASRPVNENMNEDQRQANRRVEVRITRLAEQK